MPLITINQMQKYYGDNHVLKGVDLDIDMGEVISIIGRSGSGKSTLLRCINGLEGYQEGSIKLGGMTITNRDSQAREISRSIGMVFQNFNLFPHMTALENVMLAPRRVLKKSQAECRELAQRMLEKVGLGDRLDYYPANLSGGQQQRVAIARALAMSPKVLLCDEITSASRTQTFVRVVLPPALQRIYPALVSQCIIVMLGSSVVSQVSYEELTFAANLIQSRTFLSFEVYLVTTGIYLALSIAMRQLLMAAGRKWLGVQA
ncbi:glutamate transport ATP-binding protein [Klebsiella pneumoniae]|nr:glutamate transport ATP-binding protein [Klebsiella pneumoniae]